MSITSHINELESINLEITRLAGLAKTLRKKKAELTCTIAQFIEKQDKPGLKYKGKQFLPEVKQKVDRTRTPKIKEDDARSVLENYGISQENSKVLIQEMMAAMRGPTIEATSLKIKQVSGRPSK